MRDVVLLALHSNDPSQPQVWTKDCLILVRTPYLLFVVIG